MKATLPYLTRTGKTSWVFFWQLSLKKLKTANLYTLCYLFLAYYFKCIFLCFYPAAFVLLKVVIRKSQIIRLIENSTTTLKKANCFFNQIILYSMYLKLVNTFKTRYFFWILKLKYIIKSSTALQLFTFKIRTS